MTFPSEDQLGMNGSGLGSSLPQPMNMGNMERTASIVAGAVGLLLLSRRLFVYVSLALLSAYMIYRGVTGRCSLYELANINTRGKDDLLADAAGSVQNAATAMTDRLGADGSEMAEIEKWMEDERAEDPVEQSSWESFPASDPPGGGIA